MSGAIYAAASGAVAQQMRVEIIANNLANINTPGFKKNRTVFRVPDLSGPVKQPPAVLNFGRQIDFSGGSFKHTGNSLDLSINGDGFFCIETPEGVRYTRNGNFSLDPEGNLVNTDGFTVLGEGGKINLEGDEILVDVEGGVSVDGEQVDTIKIVVFDKPYPLEQTGSSLFAPVNANVIENTAENPGVNQGELELSNSKPVMAMIEMIEAHRMFEAYQKVIQSVDAVTGKAVNEAGRLA